MIGFWISASVGRGTADGRGWVRDSISPSPASPARRPPEAENVACQTRSINCGAGGYNRLPAAKSSPRAVRMTRDTAGEPNMVGDSMSMSAKKLFQDRERRSTSKCPANERKAGERSSIRSTFHRPEWKNACHKPGASGCPCCMRAMILVVTQWRLRGCSHANPVASMIRPYLWDCSSPSAIRSSRGWISAGIARSWARAR